MENKKRVRGVSSRRLNLANFKAFLQEASRGSMTPPHSLKRGVVWRPNNYRRQIEIKSNPRKSPQELRPLYPLFPIEQNKQNKIITITISKKLKLQYAKKTLIAIWSQERVAGTKRVFHVEGSLNQKAEFFKEKKEEIQKDLDTAINTFLRKTGLGIPTLKPIWARHEDMIKGEDFLDSLPEDLIIHTRNFKKVYPDQPEFIGGKEEEPGIKAATYINNRALEEFSPEITKELNNLSRKLDFLRPLARLKEEVKNISDISKNLHLLRNLNNEELENFSDWLFKRFGVSA